MAWYPVIFNNGGGVEFDDVLTDGVISDGVAYTTANFSDISAYKWLAVRVRFTENGVDYAFYVLIDVAVIPISGEYTFDIDTRLSFIYTISLAMSKTSIRATRYGGAWRYVYADIRGIKDDIW